MTNALALTPLQNTLFRKWFPPRPTAEALKEYAARMAVTPVNQLPRDAQLIAFKAFLEDFLALTESASTKAVIDEYEVVRPVPSGNV